MASVILQEEANFTRLSKLLVDKGTEALRNTLDAIHPPCNLAAALNANRKIILRLKHRVINGSQWDLLFPPSGNPPDSKTFDVSLLTVLLRNVCGFSAPATGWDTMPPDADRSPQANFTRIRLFRNEVYAHVSSTQVDPATFEKLWQKISQALVDLKIPRKEIDDLKICALGPEEEIQLQTLKEWCLKEEDCKEMLGDLKTEVILMHQQQRDDSEALKASMQQIAGRHIENERLHQTNRVDDLSQKLAKHNFKAKIKRKLKSFHPGTRGWLLKEIEQWFTTDDESRVLLVTAGPGFGKSVFAAKVCELFKERGQFAACHFCNFSNSNLNDPMLMLESLASQMCENFPGFKKKLLDQLRRSHRIQSLEDGFQIYLQNPLDELEVEPRLIVIDGLDESATNDKSDLVKLIADYFPSLPECVKVLMTSRPVLSLERLVHIKTTTIDVNAQENKMDLEEYLKDCLPSIAGRRVVKKANNRRVKRVLPALVNKCEGSFLYAFYIQQELQKHENLDTMTFQEIMSVLPQRIGSVYQDYFRRLQTELEAVMKSNSDLFKLLEVLAAAKGSLPLSFLAQSLDLAPDCRETKRIINKVNEAVSCLLYVSDDMVTVFHKSMCDWLLVDGYEEHEYAVNASVGNKRLWLICEQVFEEVKTTVSSGDDVNLTNEVEHALGYGLEYLVACNMVDSFSKLVDMVIVHVILTVLPESHMFLSLMKTVLLSDVSLSRQLRQRISWHFTELGYIDYHTLGIRLSWSNFYLEAVLDHAPKGCFPTFTDSEKQIAKALLAKNQRHIKQNSTGVNSRYLLTAACKPFSSDVTAIGVSSNKTLVAVALKDGTICIFSLPELVMLWQYSTQYNSISCCTFVPDDSFVLYGKLETVLSIEGKNEEPFFCGKVERFNSCAFSPNGKRLVTNDGSSSVKLWDIVKQCLISVLCAGVPLACCYFTNTGLLIVGDKYSEKDSYCVWSAITLQRVDERNLSVGKPKTKGGVIKSKRCNRCHRQDRKEIIPPSFQVIPVIYNDVECICQLDQHSLRIIESTHYTTLSAWELFVVYFLHYINEVPFPQVVMIADELFLYIDREKMVVLHTVPPKCGQGCLPSPARVLWCSFSPDGTRLASCTSDGFINIWNVDMCQVYRRFKGIVGASSAACWWSDRFLFVFCFIYNTPSLSKYPVDENFEVMTTQGQSVSLCPVINEFSLFSGIVDFSEGYLSFECGEIKPVKVLDVNRSGPPENVILPGIQPMMKIAVSSGACFVLAASGSRFYLWKRNEAQPTTYDVYTSYLPSAETSLLDCRFSIDSKLAVVSYMMGFQERFVVVDVETGIETIPEFPRDGFPPFNLTALRVFCSRMELILVTENLIAIFDMGSRKHLETSFQWYITKESLLHSRLSPKGNVLTFPRVTGDMEFILFNMSEYPYRVACNTGKD